MESDTTKAEIEYQEKTTSSGPKLMSSKENMEYPKFYYGERPISPGPGLGLMSSREYIPRHMTETYLDFTGSYAYISIPSWVVTVGGIVHRHLPGI
jgi:hypothetical protein